MTYHEDNFNLKIFSGMGQGTQGFLSVTYSYSNNRNPLGLKALNNE